MLLIKIFLIVCDSKTGKGSLRNQTGAFLADFIDFVAICDI